MTPANESPPAQTGERDTHIRMQRAHPSRPQQLAVLVTP